MKIGVYSNCHNHSIGLALTRALPGVEVVLAPLVQPREALADCDLAFIQSEYWHEAHPREHLGHLSPMSIVKLPTFYFPGFHPDLIMEMQPGGAFLTGPCGSYNSSIIVHCFKHGWSEEETMRAFRPEACDLLGFEDYWVEGRRALVRDLVDCGLDGDRLFEGWCRRSPFNSSVNHPHFHVIEDIVTAMLESRGMSVARPEDSPADPLVTHGNWPVYPGIAEKFGIEGSYDFHFGAPVPGTAIKTLITLPEFIAGSFEAYRALPNPILCRRLDSRPEHYARLESLRPRKPSRAHVYSGLPASSYWRQAVAETEYPELDPVVSAKFTLDKADAIATAGSCFAQHVARALKAAGYNYLDVEPAPPELSPEAAEAANYGLFSARYGNVYTARQLLQLVRRAYGEFTPVDRAWPRADGRFVDPFRPQIDPEGHETAEAVIAAADAHLAAVRRLVESCDVLVFTLGLTECWESRVDGAVFPVAPGVAAGAMDAERHAFRNFTAGEVAADLAAALALLRARNPGLRVILTVSPVPLVATYEKRHVLVSTIYSKSALRCAAEDIARAHDFVDYFPSYELIVGHYNFGRYFEQDLRSVRPEGVAHVMRIFGRHYLGQRDETPAAAPPRATEGESAGVLAEIHQGAKVLCDEELLGQNAQPAE
ncbi:MAG: GSCFA domain-containing protein [Sphingomonadales bacterium]|nr:GSCFA domain-containing protein [Sphingomonadales bacterium]